LLGFLDAYGFSPYAVSHEGLEGRTLAQKLQANELNATEKSIILLEVARALEFLHSLRVTHRNLSPEVIYLTNDHHAKVGGLCISGSYSTGVARMTSFSVYIAPELLMNYSTFTILAWQLVTGTVPFEGVPEPILVADIVNRNDRPPLKTQLLFRTSS
jgi:serine/threonine protein kinase